MSKMFADPHKMLIRLVGLNAFFDLISIPLWAILPLLSSAQPGSTLTVDTTFAVVDAAFAVAVFAIAVFGIMQKHKWGAALAVAGTIAQRIVGVFMFSLNVGMALEVVWSVLIIYFAYKELMGLNRVEGESKTAESA